MQQPAQYQQGQQLIATTALRIRQFLNLEDILNTTVTEVRQILECDRVIFYQFASDMSGKIVAESVATPGQASLNTQINDTCFQTLAIEDYHQGKKRAINNIYEANLTERHIQVLEKFQVKAHLVVPILLTAEEVSPSLSTQLWGLLIAHQCSAPREWQATELDWLDELGVQIAISIQQSLMWEQLQTELQERKWYEQVQQGNKQVLEMIATGSSLTEILDTVTKNIEKFSPEMLCSILLLDPKGKNLRHGAAPSLPEEYNQAVDGIAIGDGVGSCGTAAYWGKPVIASDITTDPRWTNFRDLAVSHGLAACWSYPILSSRGKVLGTFAMYYRQPRSPREKDLQLMEKAAYIAGIAIEQAHSIAALETSKRRYAILAELSPVGIFYTDTQGNCLYVNQRWCAIAGLTVKEALGKGWVNGIHPDDREQVFEDWYQAAQNNLPFYSTYRFQNSQGITTWVVGQGLPERNTSGEITGYIGTVTDISEHKQLESELERRVQERTAELQKSEERWQLAIKGNNDGIWDRDFTTNSSWISPRCKEMLGYLDHEFNSFEEWVRLIHPSDRDLMINATEIHLQRQTPYYSAEYRVCCKDGTYKWILSRGKALWDESGKPVRMVGSLTDISDRKTLEQELVAREKLLNAFFDAAAIANVGLCIHDLQWRFFKINQTLADIHGVSVSNHAGKTLKEVVPEIAPFVEPLLQKVLDTGEPNLNLQVTGEIATQPGVMRDWLVSHFPIFDHEHKVANIGVIVTEITELKRTEKEIKAANAELTRSNQELENFAYVASHDLQEPLRKINSFADLLAESYGGELGERGDRYINYITDGVTRMKALIQDLLLYSRVGRLELKKQPTDLNAVLSQVKADLSLAIAQSNAVITASVLPTVEANPIQMGQLLQNLLANGIKFTRDIPPEIHIAAELHLTEWLISIRDNGIGIKPEYTEQIFVIFQRLHSRNKYPGTGIGLAVCRKIIERHGGKIWVESEPGKGSIFYFTLPVT
ncbi:MAG: PAS domain S-box protein [Nostocaceae cyanobacterium]|nr:PAS domain S-box protein [Nostocaceae cyanobacterium]